MSNIIQDGIMMVIIGAVVFGAGYLKGEDDEAATHDAQVKKLQFQLAVVNDNLKKTTKALEAKTRAKTDTIRNTPDPTGCSTLDAPADVVDSVR
jgi:hypothetical protein